MERREILIPRESGAGPVRAPCPMRRSRFPDVGLPSGRLLYKKLNTTQIQSKEKREIINKIILCYYTMFLFIASKMVLKIIHLFF